MRQRAAISIAAVVIVAAVGLIWWWQRGQHSLAEPAEVKLLAWVGYDEPEYVAALERSFGKKVSVQTYIGGEQMYTLVTQAPAGTYDVVIVDAEFGKKLFTDGKLDSLDRSQWSYEDSLTVFRDGQPAKLGNVVFGVIARWGALGLVYNTDVFSPEEVTSYNILYSAKASGRVGLLDWYLPSMGVVSKSLGFNPAYDLDRAQLDLLGSTLTKLRSQVVSIQASPGGVIDDLRSGKTAIAPGIGEWASAALQQERRPINYAIPREGGIMWVEAFAIPVSARNKSFSQRFIRAAMQPEILALLASRRAYFSQLARRSAYQHVPENIRAALNARTPDGADQIARALDFRQLPGPRTSEAEWLRVWNSFKTKQ
jgi:spermidine/putrescine transport system substrate-binding protein